jgi:hypothetical protein
VGERTGKFCQIKVDHCEGICDKIYYANYSDRF